MAELSIPEMTVYLITRARAFSSFGSGDPFPAGQWTSPSTNA